MSAQPLALQLANMLAECKTVGCYPAAEELRRLHEVNAELLGALEMVRDADEDRKKDGLPTIPPMPRARIDAAITKAKPAETTEAQS